MKIEFLAWPKFVDTAGYRVCCIVDCECCDRFHHILSQKSWFTCL